MQKHHQSNKLDEPVEELFSDKTREDLGIARGVRTRLLNNLLGRYGNPRIETVGDLVNRTERELKLCYCLGRMTLAYAVAVLKTKGLTLKAT